MHIVLGSLKQSRVTKGGSGGRATRDMIRSVYNAACEERLTHINTQIVLQLEVTSASTPFHAPGTK